MPAYIQIACEEANHYRGIHCGYIALDVPDDLSAPDVAGAVTAAGWTHDDKGYHCPRHDPAARWLPVRLSTDQDVEPLAGVRLRLRPDPGAPELIRPVAHAEFLLDPDRFDIDELGDPANGGPWRAKPVGTDWPETSGT